MDPALRRTFFEQLSENRELLRGFTPRRTEGVVSFPGKATAVIGVRRAGKTTFLHQIRTDRARTGTPVECLPILSLEDERIASVTSAQLGALVDEYADQRYAAASSRRRLVWFLDEIQIVEGWERLVRRLLDGGEEVFVSGSSAALLSREIATALRGRGRRVLIHPFAFDEAVRHQGIALPGAPGSLGRRERVEMEKLFTDWLTGGGFPEAQGLDMATRRRLLTDYVDVAILRDVVDRHRISNVVGLRWMVRHLLGNAGSRFSVEKFHRTLRSQGIAIARDTVHKSVRG